MVTDHHVPPPNIPNCCAVVDPLRCDCKSRDKNFAGVGVAFKAIVALEGEAADLKKLAKKYLDLVAIGTIGDSI